MSKWLKTQIKRKTKLKTKIKGARKIQGRKWPEECSW